MNDCLLRLCLPLHSLLECLHCTIALHCSGCPSLLQLPLHNSARRKIYNPSSSSLLHLSYNLPCSIFLTFTRLSTFARSSALIFACGQVQWTLALLLHGNPILLTWILLWFVPAAFASGLDNNSIITVLSSLYPTNS